VCSHLSVPWEDDDRADSALIVWHRGSPDAPGVVLMRHTCRAAEAPCPIVIERGEELAICVTIKSNGVFQM
jgi:hypothetical protein